MPLGVMKLHVTVAAMSASQCFTNSSHGRRQTVVDLVLIGRGATVTQRDAERKIREAAAVQDCVKCLKSDSSVAEGVNRNFVFSTSLLIPGRAPFEICGARR